VRKLIVGFIPLALTAMLTWGTNTVHAQGMGGGGLGGGGGGGGTSSSGFGSIGGTSGTGANTFSGATGTGGAGGTGSTASFGNGSPMAGYYASPLSYGLGGNNQLANSSASASGSTGSSTGSGFGSSGSYGGTSGGSGSTSGGFTNVQAPSTVAFGQAMFSVQPTSTFTQPTASTLSSSTGGLGGGSGGSATIRGSTAPTPTTATNRPTYTTYIGFTPDPAPVGQVTSDLQNALATSSDWGKANSNPVQITVNGNVAVLRGTVATDHDRELAARLAAMTPGVREVRNELTTSTPASATSVSLGGSR
jgi:hypothetical protein